MVIRSGRNAKEAVILYLGQLNKDNSDSYVADAALTLVSVLRFDMVFSK